MEVHQCDNCKSTILGLRRHCNECFDFDLCGSCSPKVTRLAHHHHTHSSSYFGQDNSQIIVTYNCDGCKNPIRQGARYRCRVCVDLDICSGCHNKNKFPAKHSVSHAMDLFVEPGSIKRNTSFVCNSCRKDITSTRWKCPTCDDFDLCSSCTTKTVGSHSPVIHRIVKVEEETKPSCTLALLPASASSYTQVKNKFFQDWQKLPQQGLRIIGIIQISNTNLQNNYNNYMSQLASKSVSANVKQLWHGTKSKCFKTILSSGPLAPKVCSEDGCCGCSIISRGFESERAIFLRGFERFGKALYFAPNSCKSHAYTGDGETKVMVLSNVVLGRSFRTLTNIQGITCAPRNYESIFGDVGKDLNWAEYAVYSNRAVLPQFLVFYSHLPPK